jgi:hypothetical protein
VTDFSDFLRGLIHLRISPQRRDKICKMLAEVLASDSLTAAQASSLRGKLYFCMLTAFNKVGRGPLRAFTERQYSHSRHLTAELTEAILFFARLIPNIDRKSVV